MVYKLLSSSPKGLFALLIDPDKCTPNDLPRIIDTAQHAGVDLILVGGSLLRESMDGTLSFIRKNCAIPIVLFPGSVYQLSHNADAILLLSLISGRNPEFLIGNHVIAAQAIKASGMEVIPTGYMLIESGATTSVQYMSNTLPIPSSKIDIAVATAIAGEQLGLKVIYLEAGSGALKPVDPNLIASVAANVKIPIIVGGGLRTTDQVMAARKAGASMVVVGNVLEERLGLLKGLVDASR
jgi:putative glycerol-1-phosphate prenyltransferase